MDEMNVYLFLPPAFVVPWLTGVVHGALMDDLPCDVQVGDDLGWIGSQTLQEIDPSARGRQGHQPPEDNNPRTWDSKKQAINDLIIV